MNIQTNEVEVKEQYVSDASFVVTQEQADKEVEEKFFKNEENYEDYSIEEDRPGFVDKVQSKVISRKFLVWVITCIFLFLNRITPKEWLYVSMIYIGTNAVVHLVSILKGIKSNSDEEGSA